VNYIERNEEERAEFLEKLEEIPENKRIYIDETGKNSGLNRTHGYAPRGKKVEGKTHGKRQETLNIVAAKCENKIIHPLEYGCSMCAKIFECWFAMLLLIVGSGYWFIMDNARYHRETVLREMAEAAGCHVVMLPKYSPDLNKIEPEWANLKSFLRNYGRNYASIGEAVSHYFKSA